MTDPHTGFITVEDKQHNKVAKALVFIFQPSIREITSILILVLDIDLHLFQMYVCAKPFKLDEKNQEKKL